MSIDIIGTLYEPSVDGETEPTALEGFHVNTTLLLEGLEAYQLFPATALRTFAGDVETHTYKFVDEAEAKSLLNWDEESEEYSPTFIPKKVVPQEIKSSQGLLLLDQMGLYEQLATYMGTSASVAEKIIFEREPKWLRNDDLILGMAVLFNLTEDQVDDMFIQASTIRSN